MLARRRYSQAPRASWCAINVFPVQPLPLPLLLLALFVLNAAAWVTATSDTQAVSGSEAGDVPAKRGESMRHIELLSRRSALDKNFMRFGRGGADNFMRFGRSRNNMDNLMRFGRGGESTSFIRLGRRNNDENSSNFLRLGRGGGSDRDSNYIRLGRAGYEDYDNDNFARTARRNEGNNFLRFGRGSDNYMRFGRDNAHTDELEEPIDNHPLMDRDDTAGETEYRERREASWLNVPPAPSSSEIWRQRRTPGSSPSATNPPPH